MRQSIIKPMSSSIKKQKGLTLISWIVILVFLLFQGVIAMNVLPVYMTDSTIKKMMSSLPTDANLRGMQPSQLKNLVAKRLSINSVYTVKPEHISVKKGRGAHLIVIEYEPRGKLIGNLDYIVSFRHEAKIEIR